MSVERLGERPLRIALLVLALASGPKTAAAQEPPVPGNCYDPSTGTEMSRGGRTIYPDKGIEIRCNEKGVFETRKLSQPGNLFGAAPPKDTPVPTKRLMGRDQRSDKQPNYPPTQENGSGDFVPICGIIMLAAGGGLLAGAAGGLRGASGRRRK